jgi:hypothetical protein
MLRNVQSLLLIGAVLGLLAGAGCGQPGQEEEAIPDAPGDVRPPEPPPSEEPVPPGSADAGVPETPDAGPAPSAPPAPPEIVEASQSVSSVSGGGTVTLRVEARPSQEGAVDFSWQSPAGALGTPSSTEASSEVSWTAPACGVGVSKHTVQVSLRQLSSAVVSRSFEISVVCPRWLSTQTPMGMGRYDHTISLLPDSGKVVVVGRYTGDNASSAELYNPVDGAWTPLANMSRGRRSHTASVLSGDRVLVAGGYNTLDGVVASAELYDPAAPPSHPWTPVGDMKASRTEHTATVLRSGKVLVTGGFGVGGALATAELYDPATRTWSWTGSLREGRYGHTATLLDSGKVLVVGGVGARGELASAELYDPGTGAWTPAGSLFMARAHHTATGLGSGQVLVVGGGLADSMRGLVEAELYEPSQNAWSRVKSMSKAREHHTATLLPSGQVLVAGGMDSVAMNSAEVYDPATRTWSPTAPLSAARSHHAACLLPSGEVLVAGGFAGGGPLDSAELYVP